MNQHKIVAFFILAFLGLAFLLFSLLVFFSRGKKAWFIKRKLKIGAQIIVITGILSAAGLQGCGPVVTCYDPLPPDRFYFQDTNEDYQIIVDAGSSRIIYGNVADRSSDAFLFQVFDSKGVQCDQGSVLPVDGLYDSNDEEILIDLSDSLLPGIYDLTICRETTPDYPVCSRQVLIS